MPDDPIPPVARRALLAGAATLGTAGLLAACGGPPQPSLHGGGITYLSFNFFQYSGYIVSGPPTTASSGML